MEEGAYIYDKITADIIDRDNGLVIGKYFVQTFPSYFKSSYRVMKINGLKMRTMMDTRGFPDKWKKLSDINNKFFYSYPEFKANSMNHHLSIITSNKGVPSHVSNLCKYLNIKLSKKNFNGYNINLMTESILYLSLLVNGHVNSINDFIEQFGSSSNFLNYDLRFLTHSLFLLDSVQLKVVYVDSEINDETLVKELTKLRESKIKDLKNQYNNKIYADCREQTLARVNELLNDYTTIYQVVEQLGKYLKHPKKLLDLINDHSYLFADAKLEVLNKTFVPRHKKRKIWDKKYHSTHTTQIKEWHQKNFKEWKEDYDADRDDLISDLVSEGKSLEEIVGELNSVHSFVLGRVKSLFDKSISDVYETQYFSRQSKHLPIMQDKLVELINAGVSDLLVFKESLGYKLSSYVVHLVEKTISEKSEVSLELLSSLKLQYELFKANTVKINTLRMQSKKDSGLFELINDCLSKDFGLMKTIEMVNQTLNAEYYPKMVVEKMAKSNVFSKEVITKLKKEYSLHKAKRSKEYKRQYHAEKSKQEQLEFIDLMNNHDSVEELMPLTRFTTKRYFFKFLNKVKTNFPKTASKINLLLG